MAVLWGHSWHSLKGTVLYVVRILADGSLAMAKPCLLCQEIINAAGVAKVYYSDQNGNIKLLRKE
jgi:deoxycytidylate deaminase